MSETERAMTLEDDEGADAGSRRDYKVPAAEKAKAKKGTARAAKLAKAAK